MVDCVLRGVVRKGLFVPDGKRFLMGLLLLPLLMAGQEIEQDYLQLHLTFEADTYDYETETVLDRSGNAFTTKLMGSTSITIYSGVYSLSLGSVQQGDTGGYLDLSEQFGTDVVSELNDFTISSYVFIKEDANIDHHGNFLWSFSNSSDVGHSANRDGIAYFRLTNNHYGISPTYWTSEQNVATGSSLIRERWQHIAIVQSGNSIRIYVDGVGHAEGSVNMNISDLGATSHNYIGFPAYSPNDHFLTNTLVTDFRVYNKALDNSSVKELADYLLPADLFKAYRELDLGDLSSVTSDIDMPPELYGIPVLWSSSHPEYISESGEVKRPLDQTTEVVLTATLRSGDFIRILTFNATVPAFKFDDPLQLHYTFKDNASFWTNGEIADLSGKGNHGLGYNVETRPYGAFDILDLGSFGHVDMLSVGSNLIQYLDDFTIAWNMYVSPETDLSPNGQMVWTFSNSDNAGSDANGYMFFGARRTRYAITPAHWQSELGVQLGQQVEKDAWQHFAVVQKGNDAIVYINGNQVISGSVSMRPRELGATSHNYIGKPCYRNDVFLINTHINDFRIYSAGMSQEYISELASNVEALNNVDLQSKVSRVFDTGVVKVYPADFERTFVVDTSGQPANIAVFNLSGSMVKALYSYGESEQITFSNRGVYLIRVEHEADAETFKVVVQ